MLPLKILKFRLDNLQNSEQRSESFSTNTQVNPKEQCKAITTRRGTVVGLKDNGEKKNNEEVVEKNDEKRVEKEKEKNDEVVTNEKVEEKVVNEEEKRKSKKQATNKDKAVLNHPPVQHLLYLHALSKKDKERQYKHFLDIFKRLQINIPFSEALEHMPSHAKFMKICLQRREELWMMKQWSRR